MKRKVVEQGGLTLMVSLPRKWAKTYSLKKGDEIDIQESGKKLILATSKSISQNKKTIHIQDFKHFMTRLIHGPYRTGIDSLEINYSEPSTINLIKKALEATVGYEIIDQRPNTLKIEMVAKESPKEFNKILKRMFLIIQDMATELYLAISNKDKSKLEEVQQLDQLVNRLTNFAERILNKHGYEDVTKTNQIYATVWALEQVADKIVAITHLLKKDLKASKITLETINDFHTHIKLFYKMFYADKREKKDLKKLKKYFEDISSATKEPKNNHEKNIAMFLHGAADIIMHLSLFFFD